MWVIIIGVLAAAAGFGGALVAFPEGMKKAPEPTPEP